MAEQQEQGTLSGPMIVNGQTMSRDEVVKLAADEKAAGAAASAAVATDKAKAGNGAETVTDAVLPQAGTEGVKPGVLYRDGKPVAEGEFIPRSRYNDELGRLRDKARAAGLDPETMQPVAKAADAGGAGAKPPAEPEKGKEPWAKDLLPEPDEDAKDAKGELRFGDTKAFLREVARVAAHNANVEANGRRAWADAQARTEREGTLAKENDAKLLHTFQNEAVPAARAKLGLTEEQFAAKVKLLKELPAHEQRDLFIWNFSLRHSANGAELLVAVADEGQTPEGRAYLAKLGTLSPEKLLMELSAMDRLVQLGLTLQGKPKVAAKTGDLTDAGKGGTSETSSALNASPKVGGTGAATDPGNLTGEALIAHLEASRKAEADERLRRIQGKR
jgi:hypothetical protein